MAHLVIADAGPLIALAGIDRLDLLRDLFGRVTVPGAVRRECLAKEGKDRARIEAAIEVGWLAVQARGPEIPQMPLMPSLGSGERGAIALAMEEPAERLLILDDRLARRYALRRGLSLIGTVRVLVLAEGRGLIRSAAHCIEAMAGNGYRISPELLDSIRDGLEGER